ncbi:MAG: hypothetical protein HMLKMBBP_03811 [Planctomycetes bacterium]|nr:hypothetical protein [Planctomycetota bacterium]
MRAADLRREAWRALRASPLRTLLTGGGIAVGTMALTLILSLSLGLTGVLAELVATDEQLRHLVVMPGFGRAESRKNGGAAPAVEGEMSDVKRQRLQRVMLKRTRGGPPFQVRSVVIDAETEKELSALPGLESARPFLQERFELSFPGADGRNAAPTTEKPQGALSLAIQADHPYYPGRLLAGRWFARDDEPGVVIHEYVLYRMGITSDEAQAALVGKTIRLTARKSTAMQQAAAMLGIGPRGDAPVAYTEDVPVLGVIRERFGMERANVLEEAFAMQADLFLATDFARKLWDRQEGRGGPQAMLLTAESIGDVESVESRVGDMGLEVRSIREGVQAMQTFLNVMTAVASVLAGIAVFVAALGIVNTLVMSVLERTKEIGLLKALGATDGDVARLFVAEAALLGFAGGAIGTALGWALSLVGDAIGRRLIEQAFLMPYEGDLFRFPAWLTFAGLAFAVVVACTAAIVPTLRAARVDPVAALRS